MEKNTDFFNQYQEFQASGNGNFIIVRGCTLSDNVGTFKSGFFKIGDITTPDAVKTTGLFKIEMYKDFNLNTYALSNKIAEQTGSIPESMFASGEITNGVFDGLIKTV